MSRPVPIGPGGTFRALMMVAAVIVVLIPVVGLVLLSRGEETELTSGTGSITLTPGNRMIYVRDEHVASLPLTVAGLPGGQPIVSDLLCARVHASNGTGLCLRRNNAVSWSATVLDRRLEATATYPLRGEPALARVSPSGRMVAWTALTSGRSLSGSFTAVTSIVDTESGREVESLTSFTATLGRSEKKIDGFQAWSVTFVDDDRFYATLSTGGKRYLALGSISERTLRAVADDVTNPAVSPDGRWIAFLHSGAGERGAGHLAVMNLRTQRITDLGDQRGVADQPAWLDDDLIAYVVRSDDGTPSIWTMSRTGGRPTLLQDGAESPSPL